MGFDGTERLVLLGLASLGEGTSLDVSKATGFPIRITSMTLHNNLHGSVEVVGTKKLRNQTGDVYTTKVYRFIGDIDLLLSWGRARSVRAA